MAGTRYLGLTYARLRRQSEADHEFQRANQLQHEDVKKQRNAERFGTDSIYHRPSPNREITRLGASWNGCTRCDRRNLIKRPNGRTVIWRLESPEEPTSSSCLVADGAPNRDRFTLPFVPQKCTEDRANPWIPVQKPEVVSGGGKCQCFAPAPFCFQALFSTAE